MVEFIVLSDDECEPNQASKNTSKSESGKDDLILPNNVAQDQKRPYKLVLVDSRRCPRMPRPKYLPITIAYEPWSGAVQDSLGQSLGKLDRENMSMSADVVWSAAEMQDDEEDPDYEDVRPMKRRRTGEKKAPKKHGKLTAPDWDVVRNGGTGHKPSEQRPTLPAKAVSCRKEARDYVKRLTANVDWEDILRHVEILRSNAAKLSAGGAAQEKPNVRTRRDRSPANKLKQYWQGVLTKSMLKLDVDYNK